LFCKIIQKDPKRTPSSCFIVCRTTSLFSVTILPLLAFHYLFITPAIEKVAGDQSSKIFHETRFSATGNLSLATSIASSAPEVC